MSSETTRQDILEAGLIELMEAGPTGLRLKRVAARAGVSISLIANYFGDRERLIAAVVLTRIEKLNEILLAPFAGKTDEEVLRSGAVEAAFKDFILTDETAGRAAARQEMFRLSVIAIENEFARPLLVAQRAEIRSRALHRSQLFVDAGMTAPGITALSLIRVVFGTLYGQLYFDITGAHELPREEWEAATTVVFRSLFAPSVFAA